MPTPLKTEETPFDFGPDAPFRAFEWITESGYSGYRVEGPNGPIGNVNPKEAAERHAWELNLLHFGPSLLAELVELRAENARLREQVGYLEWSRD